MIDILKRNVAKRTSCSIFEKEGIYTFLNPYSYLVARKNSDCLCRFDAVFVDGIMLCLFLRLVGIRVERVSFDMTSLAPLVFRHAMETKKDIFFIGGEPGVVEVAVEKIKDKYPGLSVSGVRHGYFSSNNDRVMTIDTIKALNPAIVVVGMGAPLQENFLSELKKNDWSGVGFTCGGFIHQTAASGISYYPRVIDKLNMRWLYRMFDEPKLVRRYFVDYTKFVFVFCYDALKYFFKSYDS